jgi:hypothetical protein
MCPKEACAVGAGGAKSPARASLGAALGVGWKRMRNGRCVLRKLVNASVGATASAAAAVVGAAVVLVAAGCPVSAV